MRVNELNAPSGMLLKELEKVTGRREALRATSYAMMLCALGWMDSASKSSKTRLYFTFVWQKPGKGK